MPWNPWAKREERSYADGVVAQIVAAAGGSVAPSGAETAAAELAASAYAGGLAQADVSPALPAISPDFLAMAGRECALRGELVAAIDVDADGAVRLLPAATWEVHGMGAAAEWEYVLELAGPSGSEARRLPASGVVHLTYAVDARRPWQGRSPLSTWTARTAGGAERQLGNEAAREGGYLLPIPDNTPPEKLAEFTTAISNMKGRSRLVETNAAGWGGGAAQAPRQDYIERRIGAAPPEMLIRLRAAAAGELLAAFGLHPDLLTVEHPASGPAAREHWRRWIEGWLKPLCLRFGVELSAKLERPIAVTAPRMLTSDVRAFASAYKALVEAGTPADEAAALLGLDS